VFVTAAQRIYVSVERIQLMVQRTAEERKVYTGASQSMSIPESNCRKGEGLMPSIMKASAGYDANLDPVSREKKREPEGHFG
jgi:hypothetical protein